MCTLISGRYNYELNYELIIDTIAKNEIGKVTIQLWRFPFEYNKKRREEMTMPKSHGTGILVEVDEHKFLLTAKHVCDGISEENQLFFQNSQETFLSITGDVVLVDDTKGNGVDFAIIKLSEENIYEINLIANKGFLPVQKFKPGLDFKGGEPLIAVGFPELKTKVDKKDLSIKSVGSVWLSKSCEPKIYSEYKMDKELQIGFDYHGKQTSLITNEKSKKIDPEGISGGGLWAVWEEPFLSDTKTKFGLVGILTEYKKGKYHVLWANRIELIIKHLFENFFEGKE